MAVYIISFILNMFVGILLLGSVPSRATDKSKRIYLVITTLQLGLICGFRSLSVGWDTPTYFEEWSIHLPDDFFQLKQYTGRFELGFLYFTTLIKVLGGNFQIFLIISSLFTMGSASIFIYRHSSNVLLSVFILICFPFFYSSFDIIRHFLAVSFILLGYKYVVKRKPVMFALFVIGAFLFQKSCIILGLVYFLPVISFNKKFLLCTLIITIVISFAQEFVLNSSIVGYLGYKMDSYDGWFGVDAGGTKTALMYVIIAIIAYLAYTNKKYNDVKYNTAMVVCIIVCAFAIIYTRNRMIVRLLMAFIAFFAIYVPELLSYDFVKNYNKHKYIFLSFIVIGLMYHGFMLLSSWQKVVPYLPYWNRTSLGMF